MYAITTRFGEKNRFTGSCRKVFNSRSTIAVQQIIFIDTYIEMWNDLDINDEQQLNILYNFSLDEA